MHLPEYGAHEHAARQILELAQSRNKRKGKGHVLVSGMTGSGKTFLVKQVATSLGSYSYCSCSQLFCAETGGTERRLAHLFDAEANMIILDDIDAIASKIVNALGQDVELRVLSILKYYLDKYEGIVVGITSRLEALDPEITRSGRLSHEIHVSISTASQRLAILNNILPKEVLSEGERVELAKRTHGYNFADLERLYAVAFQCALARDSVNISIRLEVFESALTQCRPFITADLPALKLHSDIEPLVGVDELKREILKLIQFPLEHGAKLHRLRLSPPRGALLYGPSGSGKTALALECALNSGLNVIHIQVQMPIRVFVLISVYIRLHQYAPNMLESQRKIW
jgi:transitional endoplasmic reticulum ATPase